MAKTLVLATPSRSAGERRARRKRDGSLGRWPTALAAVSSVGVLARLGVSAACAEQTGVFAIAAAIDRAYTTQA